MWRGTIRDDEEQPRRKGTPPADGLIIEPEGGSGRPLSVRHRPAGAVGEVAVTFVQEVGYRAFNECPICREPAPDSREHVPQGAIGGQVRTLTCARCNNGLARLEAELTDWYFDRLLHVGAEGGEVPGRRRIPRIYRRWTDEGEFVWVLDGPADPGVREMLANGGISLIFRPPDPARWRLAALKHAYLAACCHLGAIPEGPEAEVIRAQLVAARDAPSNSRIHLNPHAAALGIGRPEGPPQGPPLALMTVSGSTPVSAQAWISLAGAMLVSWPLRDTPARLTT